MERLAFIRHCRNLDMTLDEVRTLLQLRDQPAQDCGEINALLDEHIGHVVQRIPELRALEEDLNALRARSEVPHALDDCGIISGLGGLVEEGSVKRTGTEIEFVATDTAQTIRMHCTGILPDLFKEGKGVVAQGQLRDDGIFVAREVLAKHDENYMPPEAAEALKRAQQTNHKIANTVAPGAAP